MAKGIGRWPTIGSAALLILDGCTTVSSTPVIPTLPGGAITAMTPESNSERGAIPVSPVPLPGPIAYRPVSKCTYVQTQTFGRTTTSERSTLTIRAVRNRLLVTMIGARGASTALISPYGELFDFNLLGRDGQRRTPRNSGQILGKATEDLRKSVGPATHVVDDLTSIFPRYLIRSWAPGNTVANIIDERGQTWATYVYRGGSSYKNSRVAVLDMMRTLETQPQYGPVVVGYMLVDEATMTPRLFVIDSGWKTRTEQTGCG